MRYFFLKMWEYMRVKEQWEQHWNWRWATSNQMQKWSNITLSICDSIYPFLHLMVAPGLAPHTNTPWRPYCFWTGSWEQRNPVLWKTSLTCFTSSASVHPWVSPCVSPLCFTLVFHPWFTHWFYPQGSWGYFYQELSVTDKKLLVCVLTAGLCIKHLSVS